MFKFSSSVLITILVIALIGTGYFGYQENQEKNAILIKAENQYQRAFHNLNFHLNKLQEELGKALAVNSSKQISASLANVWRLAYSAQSDLGQLPLVLLPFSKTEEFLSKIADFSYRILIRDMNNEPITEKEYKTLKFLYQSSKEIKSELQNVQEKVIDNQLRWMDVELALAQEDKKMDNTIIDGFKTIDKRVEEFPETDWGPGLNLTKNSEDKGSRLKGKTITKDEAKKIAIAFLKIKPDVKIDVETNGKGADFPKFSVQVQGKTSAYLEITKVGGNVVWMIKNREIKKKVLSADQGVEKAEIFLKNHQYKDMIPVTIDEYDNSLIINYVCQDNNVVIYPDKVSIKVALDNGEVVGFQSTDYIFNHKKREIPSPKISKDEVLDYVNPNLKVTSIRLAVINNIDDIEVLTYEVMGELDENVYRIYINAENGNEEGVQMSTS
ncbi:germination protein YpeB [Vulcanibacillus modesticaldus]|nr:germination protein YpeB [Vulcanibacillus modesticaldus]